ncbi:MAG TPA: alpha/beta fold hydrolase, partial [Roseiarcus sp.]|nr:alpha/beta fold hydrolase [Roseiarcus sp.]
MTDPGRDIAPPSALLLALEPLGLFGIARLLVAAPFLATARRGVPQPVIVLPGLGASDRATTAIRTYLGFLGHQAHGWKRGRNVRPTGADLLAVAAQIRALHAEAGAPVSLVGWSRGGIIAREAARMAPEAVRMVITLGSPFAAPAATNVAAVWRRLTGEPFPAPAPEQLRALAAPLPVPSTSIYSRSDGVVAWRACRQAEGPR